MAPIELDLGRWADRPGRWPQSLPAESPQCGCVKRLEKENSKLARLPLRGAMRCASAADGALSPRARPWGAPSELTAAAWTEPAPKATLDMMGAYGVVLTWKPECAEVRLDESTGAAIDASRGGADPMLRP